MKPVVFLCSSPRFCYAITTHRVIDSLPVVVAIMRLTRFAPTFTLLALTLVGCGGSDEATDKTQQPQCENSLTEYAGDCMALAPPNPAVGFQLHYGPANYDDAEDVERFLVPPRKEVNKCFYLTTPNEQEIYFSEYHGTVRPGSHHMIVFTATPNYEEGVLEDCEAWPDLNFRFLVGTQNGLGASGGRIDVPGPDVALAPENEGVAMLLPPKVRVAFQVHYVNTTDEPILSESWANFHYKPAGDVTEKAAPLWWIGGLQLFDNPVKAGTTRVLTNRCVNNNPYLVQTWRMLTLTAHAHAHTTRFSAYKIAAGSSERQLVYEDYNWAEAKLFYYDTVNQNPTPNAANRISGASTGPLTLAPGDAIEWECEVKNNETYDISFGNQAYTAEMCNLFGVAAPGDGGPWNCLAGDPTE